MWTLQVPDELALPYEHLAHEAKRDKVDYILDALIAHLEDLEDERTVNERLSRPGRRISVDQVEKNLGLDD